MKKLSLFLVLFVFLATTAYAGFAKNVIWYEEGDIVSGTGRQVNLSGDDVSVTYDSVNNRYVLTFASAVGSGDISDVWDDSTGGVDALTAAGGDSFDASGADYSIPFTHAADCSGVTAEGRCCWDTDNNLLFCGSGSAASQVSGGDAVAGSLTSDSVLGDHKVTRGDGGGRSLQDSDCTLDDYGNLECAGSISSTSIGHSSLQHGLYVNQGQGVSFSHDSVIASASYDEILKVAVSEDSVFLGSTTDSVKVAGGGQMSFIGGADGYNIKGQNKSKTVTIINPLYAHSVDSVIPVWTKTDAALTITRIACSADADPVTELDWNIKWADDRIGLAGATIMDVLDTTSGAIDVSSGFNDDTVPAEKLIYFDFDTAPDANITTISCTIYFNYD